ncbi:MAG TPA: hypothetical protein VFG83_04345 [Kofleriaceae bacterium]|nr:hypothetical protein [Kofleriaceae bacterium]
MDEPNQRSHDRDNERAPRLPYERPQVISEEVFETLALSCAQSNPFACPGGNPDRS